jgi:hypothetical protein
VPAYIYWFGLDGFQVALFVAMLCACVFSITLGYHRLFFAPGVLSALERAPLRADLWDRRLRELRPTMVLRAPKPPQARRRS